jgi:nucleotide-binding universal stress UspA family protein
VTRELIIGYDGSANGEDALALGRVLAETLAAKPVVLSVLRYPDHLITAEELDAAVTEFSEALFAKARERLAGLEIETIGVANDSPAHSLQATAEEREPIALVLGSTHRGPVGRVLLGSVGEGMLSGAPCPIAVAPRGYAEREERSLQRIAVAVDGSEEGWSALDAAAAIAERLHAELEVLSVVEFPLPDWGAGFEALSAAEYETAVRRGTEEVLEQALARVPEALGAKRRMLEGDPADAIAGATQDVDLLIVGSRAYGPLRRALLGSVSARLMRSSPCPVLVLPRDAGEDPLGLGGEGE